MAIWIGIVLLICSIVSVYIGILQWKDSKQFGRDSMESFTEKRNAVSCVCIAVFFAIIGISINL